MKNQKKITVALLAILGIVFIAFGATYAFFSYAKNGSKRNTITTGGLTFHYQEGNRSIALTEAMPMTDAQGKAQNNYFDFEITAKTASSIGIPYYVTARVSDDSTLNPNVVRIWVTDQSNNQIVEPKNFGSLTQYTNDSIDVSNHTEKIIYQGQVPSEASNYSKQFRVRIWIDQDTDFFTGDYNNKTFKVTFNVYSSGSTLDQNQLNLETSNNLNTIGVNNVSATYDSENDIYSTITSLPTADLNINTEYPDANVLVERTDSTYTNVVAMNEGIQRLAANRKENLQAGKNYFRVTVTPPRGDAKIYKLEVASLASPQNCVDDTLCVNYYDDNYNLVNSRDDGTIAVIGGNSIPNYAFSSNIDPNNTIKKIIINGSVKEIGKEVLYADTIVEELILEEGVEKIANVSFRNMSGLIKISIPNSLTNLSRQSFAGIPATTNVNTYDNGKYIGNASNPYLMLIGTTSNKVTSLDININTKFIGDSAIYNSAKTFTSLTIPGNVKQILYNAIKSSNITDLIIEEGVEDIGELALGGIKSGANVSLPNSLKNVARNFLSTRQVAYNTYDNGYYIGNNENPYLYLYKTDSNCTDSITIHPDTEFLGQSWYSSCSNLRSITIPSKVRFISAAGLTSAFENITFESAANWKAYSNDYKGTYIHSSLLLGNVSLPGSPTNVRDLMGSNLEKYWIKD